MNLGFTPMKSASCFGVTNVSGWSFRLRMIAMMDLLLDPLVFHAVHGRERVARLHPRRLRGRTELAAAVRFQPVQRGGRCLVDLGSQGVRDVAAAISGTRTFARRRDHGGNQPALLGEPDLDGRAL